MFIEPQQKVSSQLGLLHLVGTRLPKPKNHSYEYQIYVKHWFYIDFGDGYQSEIHYTIHPLVRTLHLSQANIQSLDLRVFKWGGMGTKNEKWTKEENEKYEKEKKIFKSRVRQHCQLIIDMPFQGQLIDTLGFPSLIIDETKYCNQ